MTARKASAHLRSRALPNKRGPQPPGINNPGFWTLTAQTAFLISGNSGSRLSTAVFLDSTINSTGSEKRHNGSIASGFRCGWHRLFSADICDRVLPDTAYRTWLPAERLEEKRIVAECVKAKSAQLNHDPKADEATYGHPLSVTTDFETKAKTSHYAQRIGYLPTQPQRKARNHDS